MNWVVAIIVGYGLGCIPASVLVARRHGVDLHATADGNPGAWNALEQLGARRAWPAFAGDALKATAAGALGLALGPWTLGYAAVAAAMLGHAFPAVRWDRRRGAVAPRRGGKAVMAFVGGMFAVATGAAFLALAACLAVTAATRSFAYGARTGVVAVPLVQLAVDPVGHVAATGGLMTLVGALFGLRAVASARTAPA